MNKELNNRLEYLLYKHIAKKNDKNDKKNAIAFFIFTFKNRERSIMSFLNINEDTIEDIVNLKPILLTGGKHMSACIIFTNGNKIRYKRIIELFVNRGILCMKQITDGTQNIFEIDHVVSELGKLSGIRHTSIINRAEFVKKIIIYNNNEIITPHKNAKTFDQCTLIIN
jgi:hypothetical protein